jgi:anti-sigma regulatory factor (Ser/Thr protein kinase)
MPSSVALSPGEHAVHFYNGDAELVPGVVTELLAALRLGHSAIVIALAEHRAAFAAGLRAHDVDVVAAEDGGLLTWGDAAECAAQLVVDGAVDAIAFESTIGSLVRQAAADGAPVHAYGEIVAVLWAQGDIVAAIELERLWNRLSTDVPMALLCGYSVDLLAGDDAADGFAAVCAEHTRLVGGAPIASPAEVSRRFPNAPIAVRHARSFVADTLAGWGRSDLVDSAALVVTELATNAVRHTPSDFSVSLHRSHDAVRVAVGDSDPGPPRPRASGIDEPNGRGLLLIGGMSERWGHEFVGDGKLVWAELIGARGFAC